MAAAEDQGAWPKSQEGGAAGKASARPPTPSFLGPEASPGHPFSPPCPTHLLGLLGPPSSSQLPPEATPPLFPHTLPRVPGWVRAPSFHLLAPTPVYPQQAPKAEAAPHPLPRSLFPANHGAGGLRLPAFWKSAQANPLGWVFSPQHARGPQHTAVQGYVLGWQTRLPPVSGA